MRITKRQLRRIIRESLAINEIFGLGGKIKPDQIRQSLVAGGFPENKIDKIIPTVPEFLAKHKIDPERVTDAIKKLMQSPGDHMGGVPGGKVIYRELGWDAAKNKFK